MASALVAAAASVCRAAAYRSGGGGAAAAAAAGGRRGISSFSYVRPGAVVPMRHVVKWRESERSEVWDSAAIPWVAAPVPTAEAAGRVPAFWNETVGGIERRLETLAAAHPFTYIVAALREVLAERGGSGGVSVEEWAALTAEPSPAERAALASPDARRDAVAALAADAEALVAAASAREADAVASGEADLAVPLPVAAREAVQAAASADVLRAALALARRVSVLVGAMDAGMSASERAALRQLQDTAATTVDYVRLAGDAPYGGRAGGARPPTPAEVANGNHYATYEEMKQEYLAHRDRTDVIPRKRLPTPLHADAPSRALEDVARVVDANPSFTAADKAYIMQHYADALSGNTAAAFDWAAEKAAIVAPQPQWGVYDPERTALTEDFVDAARGAGKYSKLRGYGASEEAVPSAAVGEGVVNAAGAPLEAGQEVSAALAAYDAATAARLSRVTSNVTAALGAALGVSPKAVAAGMGGASAAAGASARQVDAARAKLGAGDKAKAPAAAAPAAAAAAPDSKAVMTSFFKRYLAGDRLPPPAPPLDGPRKELPAAAPEPAAAKGKGGKPAPAAAKKK